MKSGQLDKRVGDYAAAIVRDADLLLDDAANLNAEQKQFADVIKRYAVVFLSLYTEAMQHFSELTGDSRILLHDLRRPLSNIGGYSALWLSGEIGALNPSQTQLLQQIKTAHQLIETAFIVWVNPGYETGNQPT